MYHRGPDSQVVAPFSEDMQQALWSTFPLRVVATVLIDDWVSVGGDDI